MDHARRILSARSKRLDRAVKGFEARARGLETRIGALNRQMRDAEETIASMEAAMVSPIVQSLPLEATSARRIANLRAKHLAMAQQLTVLRGELTSAKTQAKLSCELSRSITAKEILKDNEAQALEITSLMSLSSLWQVRSG
jgi:multidrug resistance efflux pump